MKFKQLKKNISSIRILIFGGFFCILFWIVEAALHTTFFETEDNFIEHLFTTTFHELWMRTITSFFLILFSVFIFLGQRRKEKLNRFIQDVFNGIQDGISILDPELNIVQVNHWIEKMYQSDQPIVGQKCYIVYQKREDPCPWCPSFKTFKTGEMYTEIVPYPSEVDIQGWIFLSSYPIKDDSNNVKNVIEYIKDITELKDIDKKYKDAFNRAEFYKDLFAHDINNILQNILSSAEYCKLILNKNNSKNTFEELLSTIQNQVMRGTTLVSNVRKLSKIEETTMPIQKVDLNKVLQNSINSLKNSYKAKDINIQVEIDNNEQYVQANELLFDVFVNILNNSVRYNENPVIELIIRSSQIQKNKNNYLKVEIIDNGIGIEDTRKDLIFERGYMEGKSVSGMGLGLSLVKRIINSYNGKIWVENRVQGDYTKGSNFVIIIPNLE